MDSLSLCDLFCRFKRALTPLSYCDCDHLWSQWRFHAAKLKCHGQWAFDNNMEKELNYRHEARLDVITTENNVWFDPVEQSPCLKETPFSRTTMVENR